MTTQLLINTQLSRSQSLLEDGTTLSQFSPESSPTLKSIFQPSEVLLFKGIPGDLREHEVMHMFEGYGLIKDILIAHHKRYLFVQFENEHLATKCHQFYSINGPKIRNHDLYVCYTGKSNISKPKALLNPTSRFLHIKFPQSFTEVTTSMIISLLPEYCIYSRIQAHKAKTWEAFIELQDVFSAIMAKEYILQTQNIMYGGSITVTFSTEREIPNQDGFQESEEHKDEYNDEFSLPPPMLDTPISTYEELPNFSMTAFPCFSDPYLNGGSPVMGHSPVYGNGSPLLGPMSPMRNASPQLNGRRVIQPNSMNLGDGSPVFRSSSPTMNGSPLMLPMSAGQFNNVNTFNNTPINNVLHVKDLPENITPLMLFRLFGMYGNVMKIKILFNHPEKAFIEFQSPLQAELARRCLSNCPIQGRVLKVDFAKKGTIVDISLLKKEPDNKYLGDFANSSEHRYKYVGSKNHANISPPSKVLHLSNMHADQTENYYRELFKNHGKIKKFLFMKSEEKMALIEMGSVEDALNILIYFHNFDIDGKFLKVTFSKYKKIK